ncbi:predicted protein [Chaetomium globosum CBS 148.51]|uniref:Uncharacterized protein n=1 Tax=Chaetomium globosum (strain ATCC 6205 / CBS 148.51 / DSM 1962 / NBRC 6347 / NRRL 1970) TaxID=306901 RepID=Q2H2X3_CHAGB|nr:uncharacterized protein CHGG_03873 [Chaetomium globosum CBS 148.51]EAQ87254.1 predicted protein [Chaetomium globosum CBS 148.51]
MAPVTGSLADSTGDADLQCSAATPWSVFLFFASNYLAHCATVKLYPGSGTTDTAVAAILALFIPSVGLIRALFSIGRYSRFRKSRNPLERAAAAGALRMVVRTDYWRPQEGDRIRPARNAEGEIRLANGQTFPKCSPDASDKDRTERPGVDPEHVPLIDDIRVRADEEDPVLEDSRRSAPYSFVWHVALNVNKFHGKALLPYGYDWVDVHAEAKISWAESNRPDDRWVVGPPPDISSQYNWIQSLIAIFQVGSAGLTLYRSRGDQIERFGYAAYGLTVVPYLIMSVVNLMAQIATADYPNVYMVANEEMEEARKRGGVFDGVVGRLESAAGADDAEELVYDVKPRDPPGPDGAVQTLLARVSGSDVHPPLIACTKAHGDFLSEAPERDIIVPAYSPVELYSSPSPKPWFVLAQKWRVGDFILPLLLSGLSLVVIGALTKFDSGRSTTDQRGWILSWVVVGIAGGWHVDSLTLCFNMFAKVGLGGPSLLRVTVVLTLLGGGLFILLAGLFCVPAIGGFVVVAGMLRETGICEAK